MKKYLALLCVLALILGLFSGCKSGEDSKQNKKPTETVSKELSDEELAKIVAENLGVPDNDDIDYSVTQKYYWEAADRYFKNVSFSQNGRMVASASVDPIDGKLLRNIYEYEIPEALSDKLIREIDGAYKKETLESDNSNITLLEITYRYIEKWQDVADEYYNKLMEYEDIVVIDSTSYSADDFHKFIKNMKTNWERYNTEQCENYDKVLYAIYGGSMISLISAKYRYEAQRDWALQLVSIYEQL